MPRKPLIRTKEYPYHVTARCNNKEAFFSDLRDVWGIVTNGFDEIIERFECKIHAFVLMPNHFHLIISTPKEDLGEIMKFFMALITRKINMNSGRTGRVFGARYHWSLIDHEHYYDCALKYVYRNPVKAKLVDSVEAYPFSTIRWVLNKNLENIDLELPIGHDSLVPRNNQNDFLCWLNQPFTSEQDVAIKGALKKTRFNPPVVGWMRKKGIS